MCVRDESTVVCLQEEEEEEEEEEEGEEGEAAVDEGGLVTPAEG